MYHPKISFLASYYFVHSYDWKIYSISNKLTKTIQVQLDVGFVEAVQLILFIRMLLIPQMTLKVDFLKHRSRITIQYFVLQT